jgi:5-carboxymethyl-2-hydroxymuconate isomerase
MPHFIVEYTNNIKKAARILELLEKANGILIAQGGLFPTGGIRSRAIELAEYVIAGGTVDRAAFVHAVLKIGSGRSEEQKQKVGDELFEMMKAHFASLFATSSFALSMELNEFSEAGTWKQNNLHKLFAWAQPGGEEAKLNDNARAESKEKEGDRLDQRTDS